MNSADLFRAMDICINPFDDPFVAEQHWSSNQLCILHLIVCLQMLCPTVLLKIMHLDWYVDCYLLLTRKQTCNHRVVRFPTSGLHPSFKE